MLHVEVDETCDDEGGFVMEIVEARLLIAGVAESSNV